MKKILPILLVIIATLSFTSSFAQRKDFVRFSKKPPRKILKQNLNTTPFFVEYRIKKEGHLYLVLRRNGKPVANVILPVRSKKPQVVELKLNNMLTKNVIAGSGYSLKLTLCQGPKNEFQNKIGKTISIDNIIVSRLN